MVATREGVVYHRLDARRLHEGIVRQIARQIIGGALAPDTLLPPEPALAAQFGVSRTVVREAVRVLEARGLVAVKHGSGVRVQPPECWDRLDPYVVFEWVCHTRDPRLLDELLEVRRLVEGEAVALAAVRHTEDDLSALSSMLQGMQTTLHDPDAYSRLDSTFHDRLLKAAKNRMLAELMRPVRPLLDAGRLITSRQIGLLAASQHGHEEIYHAVRARDPEEAREAMQRHIAQFEQDIKRALLDQHSELEWERLRFLK